MSFANQQEFTDKLNKYYEDPVFAFEAEEFLINLGFDSNQYLSYSNLAMLFANPHLSSVPHPVTRRPLFREELNKNCDWHGTAARALFMQLAYITEPFAGGREVTFQAPQPPLLSQLYSDVKARLARVTPCFGSAERSDYMQIQDRVSTPMDITTQPSAVANMPQHYMNIKNKNRKIIINSFEVHSLFLEPLVPGMPNQNRLLICPWIASDGATYNLETLMYLFAHNLPSPVSGQKFANHDISFNRLIANILIDCWNAPLECRRNFIDDAAWMQLNLYRERQRAKYTLEGIQLLMRSSARLGNACSRCGCASGLTLKVNAGIGLINSIFNHPTWNPTCDVFKGGMGGGGISATTAFLQAGGCHHCACTCTAVNWYVVVGAIGAMCLCSCMQATTQVFYARREATPDRPRETTPTQMIEGAIKNLIVSETIIHQPVGQPRLAETIV